MCNDTIDALQIVDAAGVLHRIDLLELASSIRKRSASAVPILLILVFGMQARIGLYVPDREGFLLLVRMVPDLAVVPIATMAMHSMGGWMRWIA